jgi:hypothetical protein
MSNLLEQASLVLIPSGYKEDIVYSQIPLDGAGDLSFTRASNGTRINSQGLVEVCPWNFIEYSEQFTSAAWATSNGATVSADQTTAPNGTTTADKIVFPANSSANIYNFPTSPVGANNISVYAKTLSGTKQFRLRVDTGSGPAVSSNFTATTEWQRFDFAVTTTAANLVVYIFNDSTGVAGDLYIWGAQLNIGATAKPYFPTTDRLNVPRLTYQNGGGGCPSLLLEKQSTNLALYSEQFDNAAWVKYQGGTITANSVTSPDGTQNADTLTVASGQTYSGIYQSVSASSDVYTVSIFAKYNTKRWLFFFDASASAQGWFDIQNGVLGTIPSGHTGTIENFGNGWYRCTFKKNTAVTPAYFQIGLVDTDGFSSPTSNGSSYIWGAQLEASSYATSLINTTSSTATRVADACFKTGISSLIGQTQGTWFADIVRTTLQGSDTFWLNISDNSSNNWIFMGSDATGGRFYLRASSTTVVDQYPSLSLGRHKLAIAYQSGSIVGYIDGTQVFSSSATYTFGSLTGINLGYSGASLGTAVNTPAQVNQVALFPTRLTNAELASLTTL